MKTNENAIKKLSAIFSSSKIQFTLPARKKTAPEQLIKQVKNVNAIYVNKNIAEIAISQFTSDNVELGQPCSSKLDKSIESVEIVVKLFKRLKDALIWSAPVDIVFAILVDKH